jgi:transposase InsO family protein
VAERYGISEQTVWKWRKRDSVQDRSHAPHRLQATLTPAQEAVAVVVRQALLLPLDDLLSVVRDLFVAIDRATRWVFVRIHPARTAAHARRFLRDLERTASMKITRVLTDNGQEFTDRLFGLRKRAATGSHDFDRLRAGLDIEHRLTPPMRPQTNGLVERSNGRIEDVLQSHHFRSSKDLEQTILRCVRLYNGQLPHAVLKGQTAIDALKDWQRKRPELFRTRICKHQGCDS